MAITTRDQLVATLAGIGLMGMAREGDLDKLFAAGAAPTTAQVAAALKAKTQIAALAAIATPNATDEATAITLANANKATINLIIAALKA